MKRLALFPLLALALAGCGGGSKTTSATSCLEKAGATVKENKVSPTFAQTGIEHAFVATLSNKHQTLLLFAKNGILANQAQQEIAQLVEQLSGQSSGSLPVRRKNNVLVSWLTTSTAADDELIDSCL